MASRRITCAITGKSYTYGQDYYVNDWYVDDDFEGKWVSTDGYNDYYAWYHPEEYVGWTEG